VKLRIHENSLRLRLSRSDVEQFRQTGIRTESLRLGSGAQFDYTLEASSQITVAEAWYGQDRIRVLLPLDLAEAWAASDQISLSLNPSEGSGPSLLIEEDFQCLHRDEVNTTDDAFPNPSGDQHGARL
jgi:uncharacterized protein DUF7009